MADRYMFNTGEDDERWRLRAQAGMWDRLTFRRLGELGVGAGWRCLEVGAGSGTVVSWLVDRVGETGRVVATDIEPKWLRAIEASNLDVLEHDITTDDLEDSAHDLIVVRLVLAHQADEEAVLRKLVRALAPGGRLLVEEMDLRALPACHPPDATWHAVAGAPAELVTRAGADAQLGIKLPGMFEAAGLSEVDAEAVAFPQRMSDNTALRSTFVGLRERMTEAGIATREQIDAVIAKFDDPECDVMLHGATMVSVCGRRPR